MSKTKRKEKKERVDFIMRKSIKKMAAAMLTATMMRQSRLNYQELKMDIHVFRVS